MATRTPLALSLALLVAVAALAGCGGSSSNSGTNTSTAAGTGSSAAQGGAAVVEVASNPALGSILVDAEGQTLYAFQKDSGGKSSCAGSCAKVWPPEVTTSSPKAGSGASASMLGTVKRSDGTTQVTYAGHPLYTYTADTSPGQVNGNGVNSYGGVWNAVQPSGSKAPASTSSGGSGGASRESGTATSSGGGYGY